MFAFAFALAPLVHAQDDKVARGKYLVENVALCGDCHTPMLPAGQPDGSRSMRGAPLSFQPLQPIPKWVAAAPDITPQSPLWKRWGESGLLKFLQTALDPRGNPANPPMPAYKFSAQDAEAVVAYLKTLR
jgi:mono/diheme cytochrome c family protein